MSHGVMPAEVGYVTHMGDQGSGRQYFVKAPDGYMLDCGDDPDRAHAVALAINQTRELGKAWPDRGVLAGAHKP